MGLRPWSRLQERVEATDVGRALISAFILVTLVVMLALNLPSSALKAKLLGVANPYLEAVGFNQLWGVFAPDPRRRVLFVEARISYADGTTSTWRPPRGWPFPHSYRDVRWRKWVEVVPLPGLLKPTAIWLARSHAKDGRLPVEVTVLQRRSRLLPPGKGPDRTPWETRELIRLPITPGMLGPGNAR